MKVAYVAGPYRAASEWEVVCNIRAAEAVAIDLWRMGFAVICPHKNSALFGGIADDSVWLEGDLEILHRCDLLVTVPRWLESSGARAEVDWALRWGIPVFNWPEAREALATEVAS